jgi:hypothetical protein
MSSTLAKYIRNRLIDTGMNTISVQAFEDVATLLIGEVNHLEVLIKQLQKRVTDLEELVCPQ